MLASLVVQLERAQAGPETVAVVLAGSGASFSAGFDITLFRDPRAVSALLMDQRPALLAALSGLLEAGPKPTVAALHGAALGGGLELAMACNSRLAASGAALGLPESRLGILPGFGGTQRLPRLVGVSVAAAMMCSGKALMAQEAEAAGLVDGVVETADGLLAGGWVSGHGGAHVVEGGAALFRQLPSVRRAR